MALVQNRYLIIDYGSHSIKGVLCERGPLGEHILAMEKLPTVSFIEHLSEDTESVQEIQGEAPEETPEGKEEREKRRFWNEYEYNIVRLVQSFFSEESSFILQLPLEKLHIRDFAFPAVKPKDLAQAISFQTEESLPHSLEETEVVGHSWAADEENMHILSFGAARELVENTVKPLSHEHLVITALLADASMLAGFVRLFKPDFYTGHTLGQLDLGARTSTLNILNDGKLAFSRSLPYGGNDLTAILASVLSLNKEQAESKKLALDIDLIDLRPRAETFYHEHSLSQSSYNEILHKQRALFEKLCLEIERSLLALRCPMPECLYLSGGLSLTKGLCAFLKEKLQRNVEYYPLSLGNGKVPQIWTTALGATEQQKLSLNVKDNFLDTPFGATLKGGQFHLGAFKIPLAFSLAAVLVFAFSLTLSIFHDRSRVSMYQEKIQEFSKSIPGILAASSPEQILVQTQAVCRKRLRGLARSKLKVLDILQEISRLTPAPEEMDLVFQKLQFNSKSIQFEVELANVGESANLQQKLSESRLFKNIEIKRRKILPNQRARVIYSLENLEKKENFSSSVSCR